MGMTVAEKILARNAGLTRVQAGQYFDYHPPPVRQDLRDLPGQVRQRGQFRGLPQVPGNDQALSYPDAQS